MIKVKAGNEKCECSMNGSTKELFCESLAIVRAIYSGADGIPGFQEAFLKALHDDAFLAVDIDVTKHTCGKENEADAFLRKFMDALKR